MDIHSLSWTSLGRNVEYFIDSASDYIFIRISNKPDARLNAPPSSTGKSRLLASTSGLAHVTGDVRVALNVTIPR